MLTLYLLLLLFGVCLIVVFYVGTLFFQGYIYTEPSTQLYWQAPAAGAVVAAFISLWVLCDAYSPQTSLNDIPYNTLFFFNAKVDMYPNNEPTKTIWAFKKNGPPIVYERKRTGQQTYKYHEKNYDARPYSPNGIEAFELEYQGQKMRFTREASEGPYRRFASEQGWRMNEFDDGPDGNPTQFRFFRLLANLFFNFGLLVLMIVSLWLLLQYQPMHALGLSLVIWAILILTIIPMLLSNAITAAQERQAAATAAAPKN